MARRNISVMPFRRYAEHAAPAQVRQGVTFPRSGDRFATDDQFPWTDVPEMQPARSNVLGPVSCTACRHSTHAVYAAFRLLDDHSVSRCASRNCAERTWRVLKFSVCRRKPLPTLRDSHARQRGESVLVREEAGSVGATVLLTSPAHRRAPRLFRCRPLTRKGRVPQTCSISGAKSPATSSGSKSPRKYQARDRGVIERRTRRDDQG